MLWLQSCAFLRVPLGAAPARLSATERCFVLWLQSCAFLRVPLKVGWLTDRLTGDLLEIQKACFFALVYLFFNDFEFTRASMGGQNDAFHFVLFMFFDI